MPFQQQGKSTYCSTICILLQIFLMLYTLQRTATATSTSLVSVHINRHFRSRTIKGFIYLPLRQTVKVSCLSQSSYSPETKLTRKSQSSQHMDLHDTHAYRPNGFLPVFKPENWTSNDVVQKIKGVLEKDARRRAGCRVGIKVGHGGTLDPIATGVLVIGVGTACRELGKFLNGSKGYRAEGMLGEEYDTMDRTGTVIEAAPWGHVTTEMVQGALEQFRGEIMQRPPAFSAIKKGGRPLYELARKGEKVEVEPRPVRIDRLELLHDYKLPSFGLDIECGGGTYVRSLISDLARAIDTRAHMTALVRTKQGPFTLEDCLSQELWASDPEAIKAHLVTQV